MLYNTEGRLPYLKPEDMTQKQKEFYEIHLKAFADMPYVWMTEGKELNGPSNLFCHEVDLGMEFLPLNRDVIKADVERNGGAVPGHGLKSQGAVWHVCAYDACPAVRRHGQADRGDHEWRKAL